MTDLSTFATIRDWGARAGCFLPERLERLPGMVRSVRLVPQITWSLFVTAALVLLGAMASAVPHVTPTGRIVLLPLMLVPCGFATLGATLLARFRRKVAAFERAPRLARPAIVMAKRSGPGADPSQGLAGGRWVTIEFEDGSRQQLEIISKALYQRLAEQQSGVLYSRAGIVVDFDVASENPSQRPRGTENEP